MTDVAHETVLELDYDDESLARIVERSVAREVDAIDDDRSRTTVSRDASVVAFEVTARDLTALRAATNTWLQLAEVAERTAALGRPVDRASGREP
ncbi:KEOPS complex Pcc1-like subunit [Halorubellus sp. JP-L1]|uniref:KEOPS complex subunit Pcc1 n=1 Tax=Halorubellus sp. JP-L1 TaxID=2715753 RepID=UPI00140B9121|nr:KEOPS complex subunit Pcc1 [Halorubellus sp. JP-L1]NHN42597.1 KEOPS complex Pcc1-like subunit [Halorubellus sp. JP-L1]